MYYMKASNSLDPDQAWHFINTVCKVSTDVISRQQFHKKNIGKIRVNSFLASSKFCHLLITFVNNLEQDTYRTPWSGFKPFDNQIVFMKEFLKKVNFEKNHTIMNEIFEKVNFEKNHQKTMRGSRNIRQGGGGGGGGGSRSVWQKKSSDNFFFFFFFCPQLILQKSNGQFQRNLSFFKVPEGVQHFPGGVQLFPGGVQLHIPYRNPYNLWFSRGGSGPPVPPSGSALEDNIIMVPVEQR